MTLSVFRLSRFPREALIGCVWRRRTSRDRNLIVHNQRHLARAIKLRFASEGETFVLHRNDQLPARYPRLRCLLLSGHVRA